MNRFKFILSPSSCFCDVPMHDILAMQSADLWPHVSAVIACDPDPLCSICLDGIRAGRALSCGHIFCAVCIYRCLEAAESDPMLLKCPVCSEGALSKSQLRRCETLNSAERPNTFSLVQAIPAEALPPLLITDSILSSRLLVATGEGMMRLIEKERREVATSKSDLTRFRDTQGLRLLQDLSAEIDKSHVEWKRHVGRAKMRFGGQGVEQGQWAYQRSDGSLEYLHGVNLRCLLLNCQGDVSLLPERISASNVLEAEEWSDKKFSEVVKLGSVHVPDFPMSLRVVEIELDTMSSEAIKGVEKETKERAKRRNERDARKMKQQLRMMEAEATIEDRNRRTRENEEALIRAFFGFEERKAEEELREAREKPPPAVNSFSAVVSSMGHFPALGKSTSPTLEPSKAAERPSPQLEPLRSAWGSSSSASSFALGSSPSSDSSFAHSAAHGSGKKVLWSNNPGRRNW